MIQEEMYKGLIILLTAITGIWKAIPLGFLLKAHPLTISVMTASGGIISVLLLFFSGKKIKKIIQKKREQSRKSKKARRVQHILEKYGSSGLGLIGPLFMGQIMTIILGLVLVKSQTKFLWWVMAGTVLTSIVLTILGVYSIELFSKFQNLAL